MNNTQILNFLAKSMEDARFTWRSKDDYLGVMNDAQDFILEELECLEKFDTSLTLVASDYDYDLPSDFIKFPTKEEDYNIGQVAVGTSGKVPLDPTNLRELALDNLSWRTATAGTPEKYAILQAEPAQLIIYPAPSAAWIASNGSTITLWNIYRPSSIAEDTNMPFGNSTRLRGLQFLLKLRCLWQLTLDKRQFEDADRIQKTFYVELESARTRIIPSLSTRAVGFDNRSRVRM